MAMVVSKSRRRGGQLPAVASCFSRISIGVLIHRVSKLFKGIEDVENRLIMVDFEVGVADSIKVERATIDVDALQGMDALPRRGDQAGSVEFHLAVLANQAELDGEPEESGQPRHVLFVGGRQRRLPVGLEEVGEDRVGVKWHMAEDVVEDVRLGEIFDGLLRSDHDRGGKLASGEAREERLGGKVPGGPHSSPKPVSSFRNRLIECSP